MVVTTIFSILIICNLCSGQFLNQSDTLKLIVTIFRHGDRTTDASTTYPNDPYKDETYLPYGKGELTNLGKERMYRLGETLRKEYHSFLGPLYIPDHLYALSTDVSRAKCSLQLFLAGLYPPRKTQLEWNLNLNWNPIPYNYVARENNRILSFPLYYCPKYKKLYRAFQQSPEGLLLENQSNALYPYISESTGMAVTSIWDLFGLFFALTTQKEWGFKLPEWTTTVYPDYLTKAAISNYRLSTATPELNQLLGGFLLKKIINNMFDKLNGNNDQLRIYVYSGHELSVVAILGALDLYYPHVPNYSSCVVLELHQINCQAYVKVRYNKYVVNEFVDMEVPDCDTLCPLQDFVRLLSKNLPEDGDPCIIKNQET